MYLLHNLMHRVEEIRANAGGTTYKEISKGRFREMDVVMPPEILLRQFSEFAKDSHEQVLKLSNQISVLERARDILLPRLMNGELAV